MPSSNDLQPLDAITFYPPDVDPLIMVIYGNFTTPYYMSNDYISLYATTWNGQFGATSVVNGQYIGIGETNGSTYFSQSVGLFAGTASPAFAPQPGNGAGFSAGAKTPSLQLFLGASYTTWTTNETSPAVRRLEYNYGKTGGQWTVDPAVFVPNGGYGYGAIRAFPWFIQECTAQNNVQRQYLVVNALGDEVSAKAKQSLPFTSDAMVPQNTDIPLNCNSSGGTGTDTGTDPEDVTLRKYWTLVGVVMGSPPSLSTTPHGFPPATTRSCRGPCTGRSCRIPRSEAFSPASAPCRAMHRGPW